MVIWRCFIYGSSTLLWIMLCTWGLGRCQSAGQKPSAHQYAYDPQCAQIRWDIVDNFRLFCGWPPAWKYVNGDKMFQPNWGQTVTRSEIEVHFIALKLFVYGAVFHCGSFWLHSIEVKCTDGDGDIADVTSFGVNCLKTRQHPGPVGAAAICYYALPPSTLKCQADRFVVVENSRGSPSCAVKQERQWRTSGFF